MKKIIVPLALAFVISSAASFAGTVYGTVKDENGKPIAGAEVKIYGKDIKTKSDEKGKFKIINDNLIDGNRYSVKVNAEGYDTGQTLSTEVFDDPEEMEALDVVMYKAAPEPEPTSAPQALSGLVQNVIIPTNGIININEEVKEEMLIPEEKEVDKTETNKMAKPETK
ncbi:MAG: hypothetical protein DRI44_05525 [Chlamydiae bacterium]|nr:MAG: hypothetical protein DRI44_05525 [Chlamydiota bacterium]